ncbi:DUF805 domain-containing protein [Pararhizobium gei]|uniref:DUF805 domain-containing protein n=1 Tax=Pararhizobium gei TaxID=1395951 RepID=UPI0023DB8304|nr:DUF805 domain-containing protein [Rhizobium gei]
MREGRSTTMTWLLFSPSGRLGRMPYFLGWLFWVAVGGMLLAQMFASEGDDVQLGLWTLALVVSGLVSTLSIIMLTIKRLHDIGYPGPIVVCLFIPVMSPVVFIALCLWPGQSAPNSYGS